MIDFLRKTFIICDYLNGIIGEEVLKDNLTRCQGHREYLITGIYTVYFIFFVYYKGIFYLQGFLIKDFQLLFICYQNYVIFSHYNVLNRKFLIMHLRGVQSHILVFFESHIRDLFRDLAVSPIILSGNLIDLLLIFLLVLTLIYLSLIRRNNQILVQSVEKGTVYRLFVDTVIFKRFYLLNLRLSINIKRNDLIILTYYY